MSSAVGAPKQHKQPSRKGKRAWRKNVDITQVQDGLEALREEIIQTGSGPISEQKAEELFAVDISGNDEVRRKLKSAKPLKVDEILAKRSAVPAVDSRKRTVSRLGDGILEHQSKRQRKDWVSKKELARLKQVAGTVSRLTGHEDQSPAIDLWADDSTLTTRQTAQDLDFIPKTKPKVAPSTLKRAPIAMTASGKPIKAVLNPNAGTSYNPDFEQWDALLVREGAKEIAAEKARQEREVEQTERQARIDAITNSKERDQTEDESLWEGFETDHSETVSASEALKNKRPQRKTPAQRNKAKRKREADQLAKHEAQMATKQNGNLVLVPKNSTNQEINTLGNSEADEHNNNDNNDNEDSYNDIQIRRRRLGPSAIAAPNLELVLPDELQESLRQLKPEGNLLQDRFRNLLVNGKIESRKPVAQPRKRKVKVTEKWSYKDFELSV